MEIITLEAKADGSKPGRTLIQFDRHDLESEMDYTHYDYSVIINPGIEAGNHFHLQKREAFASLSGRMEVTFEDPNNPNDREVRHLTNDGTILVVPRGIAHKVKNIDDIKAVLWVFASHPARQPEDDHHYEIVDR